MIYAIKWHRIKTGISKLKKQDFQRPEDFSYLDIINVKIFIRCPIKYLKEYLNE